VPARVREELAGAGIPTVSVCTSLGCTAADEAIAAGAKVVVGDPDALETWLEAGLHEARAIGLLSEDDLVNLSSALLVAEHTPDEDIVVRMFSSELSGGIEEMLGGRGTVLSETEVAAPAFVQAALSGNVGQRVTVGEHVLEVAQVDPDDPSLVVALCPADEPETVFPGGHARGDMVGLIDPAQAVLTARGLLPATVSRHQMRAMGERDQGRPRPSRRAQLQASLRVVPPRAFALLAVIAFVALLSATVFTVSDHLDFIDALYFTVTTMATVGYGDVNLIAAPDWLKVYDIGLMAVSAVLIASVLALVTDILVASRIDRALGRFPRPRADHVVVCGLGKAGARVVTRLHELGIPCIAVEHHDEAVGIPVARALEIPVVFADMRTPGTLDELNLGSARAVMAVTSDDLVNLHCGLAARERHPDLRVVLRIFDAKLAERLDRGIESGLTRSVSALAAPAFSAALLGRPLAQPLSGTGVPMRVLRTTVPPDSPLVGRSVGDLHRERRMHVLSLGGRWRPWDGVQVQAGDAIALVITRDAADELETGARAGTAGIGGGSRASGFE
jgi:Trk K+ transport system NAD-binding subunit